MSAEQQAYEAMALLGAMDQAAQAHARMLSGGKRQRCVCGALEGESCRDHSDVVCFTWVGGQLERVEQGGSSGRVLWEAKADASADSDTRGGDAA